MGEKLEKYQIVEKSDESKTALLGALQGQKKPLATSSQGACKVVASRL
jgi:hypothetical protein